MCCHNSVRELLEKIKSDDDEAIGAFWRRYFPQLVDVARRRLEKVRDPVDDEEDVALSALNSFCRAVKLNRFPELADREGLWRLLFRMTVRKAIDRIRRAEARAVIKGESAIGDGGASGARSLEQVVDDAPSHEFAAMLDDQMKMLLNKLHDPQLRAFALARMEGRAAAEIAQQHNCSTRTVYRRLALIKSLWQAELRDLP